MYQQYDCNMITGNNVECYLCTHSQGYYGNLFLWFFNLHQGLLDAPLRPRKTVKEGSNEESEYYIKDSNVGYFHFRPDDYHKWFIQDMDWNGHIQKVMDDQTNTHWRPKKDFHKLIVKANIHAPHRLLELDLLNKTTPKVIYNLTVDKDNIKFLEKIAKRNIVLNNKYNISVKEIVKELKAQHIYSTQAIEEISKKYTVCNVDVHKLFFEYDNAEYENVLKFLDTEPISNWHCKIRYAKELINE